MNELLPALLWMAPRFAEPVPLAVTKSVREMFGPVALSSSVLRETTVVLLLTAPPPPKLVLLVT